MERALQLRDDCLTRFNLGLVLEQEHRPSVAARHLRSALRQCSSRTYQDSKENKVSLWDVQAALSRMLRDSGQLREAEALLRSVVVQLHPVASRTRLTLRSIEEASKSDESVKPQEFTTARQAVVASNGTLAAAYSELAATLVMLERDSEAAEMLSKVPSLLSSRGEKRLQALIAWGNRLLHMSLYERASKVYSVAQTEFPDSATAYNNMGVIKCNQGDYAAAVNWFNRALDVDPSHKEARLALARVTKDGPRFKMPLLPEVMVKSRGTIAYSVRAH